MHVFAKTEINGGSRSESQVGIVGATELVMLAIRSNQFDCELEFDRGYLTSWPALEEGKHSPA
jgi:hypothetical protein